MLFGDEALYLGTVCRGCSLDQDHNASSDHEPMM